MGELTIADVEAITQTLTIKLRLRDRHGAWLRAKARAVNAVWNYCNEVQHHAIRWGRPWPSRFDLTSKTAGSSKDLDLRSESIECVALAYAANVRASGRQALRWRGRRSLGWVPFKTGTVRFDGKRVHFNRVAFEPMHLHPRLMLGAKIRGGSFNSDSAGRWYVNLTIDAPCTSDAAGKPAVGIDLGLKSLATLSNGAAFPAPRLYRSHEERIALAQRASKTSRHARLQKKVANRRNDFLHKASRAIVEEFGVVVVGDVSPSQLARTTMAKSINDAAWSTLRNYLSYKTHLRGGRYVEVGEAYTTQTCSECGSIPASRPRGTADLGIREWNCSECGAVHDRDVNAARNILRLGLETLAEGAPSLVGSSQSPMPSSNSPLPPNHEGGR